MFEMNIKAEPNPLPGNRLPEKPFTSERVVHLVLTGGLEPQIRPFHMELLVSL